MFGLVLRPASHSQDLDWDALADRLCAVELTSMTSSACFAFWFASEQACADAEILLHSTYRDSVVCERATDEFSLVARVGQLAAPRQVTRDAPSTAPVACVYGECAQQRLPICARSVAQTWRFEPFWLPTAELAQLGVDAAALLHGAQLSIMSGSVRIGVHGVDDATAKRVCDAILDEPRVAAAAERLLWLVAHERHARAEITFDGVTFVAHDRLPPPPVEEASGWRHAGAWLIAEPHWLGVETTDSSAKSIAGVVHRAVASLLKIDARNVFAVVTSPTLPFIKDRRVAPQAFIDMLDDTESAMYGLFEHAQNKSEAEWPSAVRQIVARFDAGALSKMPATLNYCWPKGSDAVLLFGLRKSKSKSKTGAKAKSIVERAPQALAIMMSAVRRLPKQDLPTFERSPTQVLCGVDEQAPNADWICAILSGQQLSEQSLRKLVLTVRQSPNLQVVDVCNTTCVTAAVVNDLLAISHVRVVAIAGVDGVERIVEECQSEHAHKLVWVALESVWVSGLSRAQIERHTQFFAFQSQARAAYTYEQSCGVT
jgi:hypothetical protein